MIHALLLCIVVASLLQPWGARLSVGLMFSVSTSWHVMFLWDASGLLYYGGAALVDLGIIAAIGGLREVCAMSVKLQIICALSIVCNLGGFVLWWFYLPPEPYNAAITLVYIAALTTLIRGRADVGGSTTSWGADVLRVSLGSRSVPHLKNGGTV